MDGISFFIHDLNAFGGQDRSTLEILADLSHEMPVHVYACTFDGSSRPDHRIQFHRCPFAPRRPVLVKSALFQLWSAWVRLTQPRRLTFSTGTASLWSDFVHVQFVANAWKEERRKLTSGKPPVMRLYHRLLSLYNEGAEKVLFSNGRSYVPIAHTVADQLRRHFDAQDLHVIHHGVDTTKFAPASSVEEKKKLREKLGFPQDRFVFLLVGAYERKGLATLVSAAKELRDPRLAVVAVGAGDANHYRRLAGEGCDSWLHLHGPSREIEEYYRAADAFVLPTLYEPFGLVILEAMAAGLPSIVSKCAGAAELVTDGKTGWLLRDPADPAELGAALSELLTDPSAFREMGVLARAEAEKRSWKLVAKEFSRLIRERSEERTLVVTSDYPPKRGGIATYSHELAQALRAHGPVNVLAPSGSAGEGIPVHHFRSGRGKLRDFCALASAIDGALKRQPSTRLFCTNWYPAGLAALLSPRRWWANAPYFVAAHGAELLDRKGSLRAAPRRWLRRLVLRRAASVFSVSRFTAARVSQCTGASRRPQLVVPNGVNTAEFFPGAAPAKGPFRILSVCRLERHKGVDTALAACALLKAKNIPFIYEIVGTGPDRARLESLASALDLLNEVRFLDDVKDLRARYQGADVFLLLSREISDAASVEGFGLVFLEAAACGLTSVGSRSGGIPDAVLDGETGLLVPPRDAPAAAAALERLYRDPSLRHRLAERARQRTEGELSWSEVAARLSHAMDEAGRA